MADLDQLPADEASALRLLASGMSADRIGEALSITAVEAVNRAARAADAAAGQTADALAESERRRILEVAIGLKSNDPLLEGSPAAKAYRDAILAALSPAAGSTPIPTGTRTPNTPSNPPQDPSAGLRRSEPSSPNSPDERSAAVDDLERGGAWRIAADPARRRALILLAGLGIVLLAVVLTATGAFDGGDRTAGSPAGSSVASTADASKPNQSADGWQLRNRIQLTSPANARAAALAGVETKGSQSAVAITGLGLPAGTVIGIWITGGGRNGLVGFQRVGANGRFSAIGALPDNAPTADRIIVSRERYAKGARVPASPGETLLSGKFSLS